MGLSLVFSLVIMCSILLPYFSTYAHSPTPFCCSTNSSTLYLFLNSKAIPAPRAQSLLMQWPNASSSGLSNRFLASCYYLAFVRVYFKAVWNVVPEVWSMHFGSGRCHLIRPFTSGFVPLPLIHFYVDRIPNCYRSTSFWFVWSFSWSGFSLKNTCMNFG